jgi:hypothetical protein
MSAAGVMAVQRRSRHASTAGTLDGYPGLFDDDLTALAERADSTHDGLVTKRLGTDRGSRPPQTAPRRPAGSCAGR